MFFKGVDFNSSKDCFGWRMLILEFHTFGGMLGKVVGKIFKNVFSLRRKQEKQYKITRTDHFQVHYENLVVKYGNELLYNVSEKEKPCCV